MPAMARGVKLNLALHLTVPARASGRRSAIDVAKPEAMLAKA
jgi:hypothetical protein